MIVKQHCQPFDPATQALAKLVSNHMGGAGKSDAQLKRQWQKQSRQLRRQRGSVVIPISALTAGLTRHRALLFKVLADCCQIPCRLLRGQFYTGHLPLQLSCVMMCAHRGEILFAHMTISSHVVVKLLWGGLQLSDVMIFSRYSNVSWEVVLQGSQAATLTQ